ncbi:MAG: hypothetical protein V1843_02480 [bacterium]
MRNYGNGTVEVAKKPKDQKYRFHYGILNLDDIDTYNRSLEADKVTILDLSGHDLGDEGAKKVAELLKINKTIVSINLSGDKIGPEGAKALAEALKINKNLKILDLSNNDIGINGGISFARALTDLGDHNETLEVLILAGNDIGNIPYDHSVMNGNSPAYKKKCRDFFMILGSKSLTDIDISNNRFDDLAIKVMSDELKRGGKLISLNLNSNAFGDEGAKAIAEAIRENKTLARLYIGGNDIGNQGVFTLISALNVEWQGPLTDDLRQNFELKYWKVGHENDMAESLVRYFREGLEEYFGGDDMDGICEEAAVYIANRFIEFYEQHWDEVYENEVRESLREFISEDFTGALRQYLELRFGEEKVEGRNNNLRILYLKGNDFSAGMQSVLKKIERPYGDKNIQMYY